LLCDYLLIFVSFKQPNEKKICIEFVSGIEYNKNNKRAIGERSLQIREIRKPLSWTLGRYSYLIKNYRLLVNKAIRVITKVEKAKSSASVMYICITSY